MSGIGPVEPVDSPETDASYDIIGGDSPRLSDRWHSLTPRARKATLAAGVIALAATGVVLLPRSHTPRPAPPQLAPWPANVTQWRYLGLAQTTDFPTASGFFRFAVSVNTGPPVTLRVTGAAFDGLTAQATPEPSFTVNAGATRRITVEVTVSDCSGLPLNADLPFLDVTLRNTRAIQHNSFIFGSAYSKDLSRLLHAACDATNARPGPQPSGSARSQNVD
ncbi:hypothetical protein R6V09_18055 [Streptomyces sp. W16]|uniref:hypothetical protein n=1 Tax=Streptomyces sp. W16 TaxID=3076631 RepID=UPI00295C0675|nr:hypothetical protein [Streptomyces sp. W16]MDV9172010.1 hypothetical protein [Streptomyces sp. W16]